MTGLTALWLPILLAAGPVFVVSSIIHTVLPWHRGDYRTIPDQDKVQEALRPFAIPPGDYMMPRPATRQDVRAPEFLEKAKKGPVMVVTVMPNGMMGMGKSLAGWFVYAVVVGMLAALVAGGALPPGAAYGPVFHFAGITAFVGYSVALWQMS